MLQARRQTVRTAQRRRIAVVLSCTPASRVIRMQPLKNPIFPPPETGVPLSGQSASPAAGCRPARNARLLLHQPPAAISVDAVHVTASLSLKNNGARRSADMMRVRPADAA
jgi:hypothetical protein